MRAFDRFRSKTSKDSQGSNKQRTVAPSRKLDDDDVDARTTLTCDMAALMSRVDSGVSALFLNARPFRTAAVTIRSEVRKRISQTRQAKGALCPTLRLFRFSQLSAFLSFNRSHLLLTRNSQLATRTRSRSTPTSGWTQAELALKISEKATVIKSYESDSKCIPNAQVLSKLEAALGVKLRGTLD
jgi:hypothetical protein